MTVDFRLNCLILNFKHLDNQISEKESRLITSINFTLIANTVLHFI